MAPKYSKKKSPIKGITYYYDKEENVIIRFVSANYLLWEQKYKKQIIFMKDLK